MSSAERREVAERVRFARAYAAEQLPWFSPALFRSRIVITPRVDVATIDLNYNVYWNPEVVNRIYANPDRRQALSELAFLWVHEISHRLRKHGERARGDSRGWNIACDFEINDADWRGLQMPAAYPGMLPQDFGFETGLLAENYLALMDANPQTYDFNIDEGSGVHGQVRPWEEGDRQRISPLDEELIRREVARRTREADASEVPAAWRDWAAEVLNSRVNWRQRLGRRMSVATQRGIGSRTDYSYARPSRRQSVYHPILPPSLGGDRTARIAIVVDTSASMQATELQRALTEVAGVIRQFDYPVTIIPCDIKAYEPVRIVAQEEAYRLTYLPGGSGTNMIAGIEAALHLRPRPDSVLVLTDGLTEYPPMPYKVPVVFGILTTEEVPPLPPTPPFSADQIVLI
jgi:predicted metal-dependent peptidase